MDKNIKNAIFIVFKGLLIFVLCIIINSIIGTAIYHLSEQNPIILVITEIICFGVTLLIAYLLIHYVDKESFKGIGLNLKGYTPDLLIGFIVSVGIIITGTFIIIIFRDVKIACVPIRLNYIIASFIITILGAASEEIVFRGYILNKLSKIINSISAVLISSLLFSIPHLLNPNISFIAIINTFIAGILMGLMYLRKRNLWLPISFHVFWNACQAFIGYNISGIEMPGIFKLAYEKESFLNGGAFGFEGSYICTLLLIIAIIILFVKQSTIISNNEN